MLVKDFRNLAKALSGFDDEDFVGIDFCTRKEEKTFDLQVEKMYLETDLNIIDGDVNVLRVTLCGEIEKWP